MFISSSELLRANVAMKFYLSLSILYLFLATICWYGSLGNYVKLGRISALFKQCPSSISPHLCINFAPNLPICCASIMATSISINPSLRYCCHLRKLTIFSLRSLLACCSSLGMLKRTQDRYNIPVTDAHGQWKITNGASSVKCVTTGYMLSVWE